MNPILGTAALLFFAARSARDLFCAPLRRVGVSFRGARRNGATFSTAPDRNLHGVGSDQDRGGAVDTSRVEVLP